MLFKKLSLLFLMISGFNALSAMEPRPLDLQTNQTTSYLDLLPKELLYELTKFNGFKYTPECAFWLQKDIEFHKEDMPEEVAKGSLIYLGSKYFFKSEYENKNELWDISRKECIRIIPCSNLLVNIWPNSTDTYLLIEEQENDKNDIIKLYDIENEQEIILYNSANDILELDDEQLEIINFSSDGSKCMIRYSKGTIAIFDLKLGKLINKFKRTIVDAIDCCINEDGTKLAACHNDNEIKVWDVCSGRCQTHTFNEAKLIHHLCFSPDGQMLAFLTGDPDDIDLESFDLNMWNLITNDCSIGYIDVNMGNDLKFSPDGRKLVVTSGDIILGVEIKIFDVKTLEIIKQERIVEVYFAAQNHGPSSEMANDGTKMLIYSAHTVESVPFLHVHGIENNINKFLSMPAGTRVLDAKFIKNNTQLLVVHQVAPSSQVNLDIVCTYNLANQEVQNHLYNNLSIAAAQLLKEAYECHKEGLPLDLSDNQKKEIFNHLPGRLKETIRGTIEIDEIGKIDSFIDNLDEALQGYAQSEKEDQKKNLKRPYPE